MAAASLAFSSLALSEIVAFTSLLNLRSQAVMKKLGMQNAGEHFRHPGVPVTSPLSMHCLYRLHLNDLHTLAGLVAPGCPTRITR